MAKQTIIASPGTDSCDLCQKPLRRFDTFYDANTRQGWGWLCRQCFQFYGLGLGTGLGQEFNAKDNVKIRG